MKQFVETESEDEAHNECPWASIIIRVEYGFMCFDTQTDYEVWLVER